MFDYDLQSNIEQELSEIPPEYQDAFRQAIERELADTEQNRTDSDILIYLRQRREDFRRGSFIRPDGRPGIVALNPETMYEQALPELAKSNLVEEDDRAEHQRTLIKICLFGGVALLFLFLLFRGRAQRDDEPGLLAEGTLGAEMAGSMPMPTQPLPEITGIEDSLQTIGSLGGVLTIGRPSAIELYYGRTEETIALAIDPSRPTTRGELRYNEMTMLSDNPVAVWLFGTVLNYAIGIPDSMVRNLEFGDRIIISTDTGASLHFVVAETGVRASYEAGTLFSQNRLGLTLFALPAIAENDVALAFANYDITSEEGQGQVLYDIGDMIALPGGGNLEISGVILGNTTDGRIRIVVEGSVSNVIGGSSVMLSLTSSHEQTTAVSLVMAENGDWQANYTLPGSASGLPLFAEFRILPNGNLIVVRLGELANLVEHLDIEIGEALWDGEQGRVMMEVVLHNPEEGAIYVGPEWIQIANEGGDVYEESWQVIPNLPILIHPGETVGMKVSFLPKSVSMQLQIGADLWHVGGIPTVTGQLPVNGDG